MLVQLENQQKKQSLGLCPGLLNQNSSVLTNFPETPHWSGMDARASDPAWFLWAHNDAGFLPAKSAFTTWPLAHSSHQGKGNSSVSLPLENEPRVGSHLLPPAGSGHQKECSILQVFWYTESVHCSWQPQAKFWKAFLNAVGSQTPFLGSG